MCATRTLFVRSLRCSSQLLKKTPLKPSNRAICSTKTLWSNDKLSGCCVTICTCVLYTLLSFVSKWEGGGDGIERKPQGMKEEVFN